MDNDLRNAPTHVGMFISAMGAALRDDDIREEFQAMTGQAAYTPPQGPLEALIDAQTGADRARLVAFAHWFAEHVWGSEEAPDLDAIFPSVEEGAPAR